MKARLQKIAGALLSRLDEWLFPDNVLCLCCDRALGEDAKDGICPACADALQRMNQKQEESERISQRKPPEMILPSGFSFIYTNVALCYPSLCRDFLLFLLLRMPIKLNHQYTIKQP